jgi:hypothetical protein
MYEQIVNTIDQIMEGYTFFHHNSIEKFPNNEITYARKVVTKHTIGPSQITKIEEDNEKK